MNSLIGMESLTKLLLLPTAYLPPLEYWVVLCLFDRGFVELHETYPKQSWRNRCGIMTANGPLNLIIPVNKPHGNHTKTKDILISDHENWQKKHWQSIVSAYSNAPFFLYYKDLIEPFYKTRPDFRLWKFNHSLFESLLSEIKLPVTIEFTKEFHKNPEEKHDLRHVLTPKRKNPLIKNWRSYYQVFDERHGFIPNLSVIDLLFHLGPDAANYLKATARQIEDYPSEG